MVDVQIALSPCQGQLSSTLMSVSVPSQRQDLEGRLMVRPVPYSPSNLWKHDLDNPLHSKLEPRTIQLSILHAL